MWIRRINHAPQHQGEPHMYPARAWHLDPPPGARRASSIERHEKHARGGWFDRWRGDKNTVFFDEIDDSLRIHQRTVCRSNNRASEYCTANDLWRLWILNCQDWGSLWTVTTAVAMITGSWVDDRKIQMTVASRSIQIGEQRKGERIVFAFYAAIHVPWSILTTSSV